MKEILSKLDELDERSGTVVLSTWERDRKLVLDTNLKKKLLTRSKSIYQIPNLRPPIDCQALKIREHSIF